MIRYRIPPNVIEKTIESTCVEITKKMKNCFNCRHCHGVETNYDFDIWIECSNTKAPIIDLAGHRKTEPICDKWESK